MTFFEFFMIAFAVFCFVCAAVAVIVCQACGDEDETYGGQEAEDACYGAEEGAWK